MDILAWLAAILTILVLLYLILGDNPLFRLVSYTFIGVAAGYVFVVVIFQVLIPRLADLFFSTEILWNVVFVIELILCFLLFLKLWPRTSALGTLPMAILVGVGAAVAIGGALLGTLFGQVGATFSQIPSIGAVQGNFSLVWNCLFGFLTIIGIVGTLAYFQFGVRSKETGPSTEGTVVRRFLPVEILAMIGQFFIGVTLGSVFAGVFTAAISALVERLGFLLELGLSLFK